jgi:peptide/nickel transport system substrate-binding protein
MVGEGPQNGQGGSDGVHIRTFLIADVRGYTLFTQERGDEAAGKLAAKFARIAREGVEGRGGTLLELRGDEALCVFGSPRQAIRAAVELQERFVEETVADPDLPLTVGIGLDAGEAVEVEGGYRGGALNLAARLCGQARAGEILASREVAHLARRIDGARYDDRGSLTLKGLAEPVAVVRVVPEGIDPVQRLSPYAPVRPPEPRERRRPPWPALIAAVLAIVLIAVGLPILLSGGSVVPEANSVARIDPGSGKIDLATQLQARPGAAATGFGSVWVAEPDRGIVVRLDAVDGRLADTIPVGKSPTGVATGEGSVWVTNAAEGTVSRISPATNQVTETLEIGSGASGIAVGGGFVWVADAVGDRLVRVDPSSGERAIAGLAARPAGVAHTADAVWVASVAASRVARVDPNTLDVTIEAPVGNGPAAVLPAFGSVWVANQLDGTVSRLDPETGRVRSTVAVGNGPNALAAAAGKVWVANELDGTVVSLDPASDRIDRRIHVGSSVGGLVGSADAVWASVGPSTTAHLGGTLRIVAPEPVDSYDPAIAYDPDSWQLLSITNDGLVAFKKTGGPDGGTLVPDLASALPVVSDDGLVYRFPLRRGIRYSTGDPVRPEDFRYALERSFALNADAANVFPSLAGAGSCQQDPSSCDLSHEVEVAPDAVTFHLAFPDPDFAYRLALPFASPVPSEIPVEDQGLAAVPATGPYAIVSADRRGTVLERNAQFREWSPAAQPDGFVDRIDVRYERDPGAEFDRLLDGEIDWINGPLSPDAIAELKTAHPEQLVQTTVPQTIYLGFNMRSPPFDDRRVRQAINFATDRARVQQILGGPDVMRITCQVLPPNFPGYTPHCPYTKSPGDAWSAPDLDRARDLIRSARVDGAKVDIWAVNAPFLPGSREIAVYFVDLLDRLGFRASLHLVKDLGAYFADIYQLEENSIEMYMSAWFADYPEPGGFIDVQFRCAAASNNEGFCERSFDNAIAEAHRLESTDRTAANAAWAGIERRLVDEAVWVPLANPVGTFAFSARVGNAQVHPEWGVLLSRLWVR